MRCRSTRQRPVVGERVRRHRARELVRHDPVGHDLGSRVALEPLPAEVRLRGHRQVLRRLVGDGGELPRRGLPEQLADRPLGVVVVALALLDLADVAAPVDEVLGRPGAVLVRVPGLVAVVDRDRVADAELAGGLADVGRDVLERELGRVHADDPQARLPVGGIPRLQVRQRAQAVDAGVGPEVDEHDLASKRRDGLRLRVDPRRDASEVRRGAVVLQGVRGRLRRSGSAARAACACNSCARPSAATGCSRRSWSGASCRR